MARHETASSKPDETSVANIENPTQAQDLDEFGGGWAGSSGGQVFEVTDLTIPSGTDWSEATDQLLATITFTPEQVVRTLSLEVVLSAALQDADIVFMGLIDNPNFRIFDDDPPIQGGWCVGPDSFQANTSNGPSQTDHSHDAVGPWIPRGGGPGGVHDPAIERTYYLGLWVSSLDTGLTYGPTANDITVLRATAILDVIPTAAEVS